MRPFSPTEKKDIRHLCGKCSHQESLIVKLPEMTKEEKYAPQ